MPKTIDVQGVGLQSFPDDATDAEISAALNSRFTSKTPATDVAASQADLSPPPQPSGPTGPTATGTQGYPAPQLPPPPPSSSSIQPDLSIPPEEPTPPREEIKATDYNDPLLMLNNFSRFGDWALEGGRRPEDIPPQDLQGIIPPDVAQYGAESLVGAVQQVVPGGQLIPPAVTQGVAQSLGENISGLTSPNSIGGLVAMGLTAPVSTPLYGLTTLAKLPEQYARVKEAAQQHGAFSVQAVKAATDAGIADVLAALAIKAGPKARADFRRSFSQTAAEKGAAIAQGVRARTRPPLQEQYDLLQQLQEARQRGDITDERYQMELNNIYAGRGVTPGILQPKARQPGKRTSGEIANDIQALEQNRTYFPEGHPQRAVIDAELEARNLDLQDALQREGGEPNATQKGIGEERYQPKYQGVPQGTDVRTDTGQVREGGREPTGGGGGAGVSPPGAPPETPVVPAQPAPPSTLDVANWASSLHRRAATISANISNAREAGLPILPGLEEQLRDINKELQAGYPGTRGGEVSGSQERQEAPSRQNADNGPEVGQGGVLLKPYGAQMLTPEEFTKVTQLDSQWGEVNNRLQDHLSDENNPTAMALMAEQDRLQVERHKILNKGRRQVVIVGGGPGGMSAAIALKTDGYDVVLIEGSDRLGGAAKNTSRVENYPGFPIGIEGHKLMWNMALQARRHGVEVRLNTGVTKIARQTNGDFLVQTGKGDLNSQTVILATGLPFRELQFPGAEYGTVADGHAMAQDAQGGTGMVVGAGNSAGQAALAAANGMPGRGIQPAQKVYLVARSGIGGMSDYLIHTIRANPKIEVIEGFKGRDVINSIEPNASNSGPGIVNLAEDKGAIPVNGITYFVGLEKPKMDWMPQEIQGPTGIVTDTGKRTSVPGLLAVGDLRHEPGGIPRVARAVGHGSDAAGSVADYIENVKQSGILDAEGKWINNLTTGSTPETGLPAQRKSSTSATSSPETKPSGRPTAVSPGTPPDISPDFQKYGPGAGDRRAAAPQPPPLPYEQPSAQATAEPPPLPKSADEHFADAVRNQEVPPGFQALPAAVWFNQNNMGQKLFGRPSLWKDLDQAERVKAEQEFQKQGQPPPLPVGATAVKDVGKGTWDQMRADRAAAPNASVRVAEDLRDSGGVASPVQWAHLIQRRMDLEAEHAKVIAQRNVNPTEANRNRLNRVSQDLADHKALMERARAGGENTPGATQLMDQEAMNVEKMRAEAQAKANDGKPLSTNPALDRKVTDIAGKLEQVNKDIADRQAHQMFEQALADTRKDLRASAAKGEPEKPFLQDAYDAAQARKAQRRSEGRQNLGIDPVSLYDDAVIGAYWIGRGLTKFADWAAEVGKHIGQKGQDYMEELFARSKQYHIEATKTLKQPSRLTPDELKEMRKLAKTEKAIGQFQKTGQPPPARPVPVKAPPRDPFLVKKLAEQSQLLADYNATIAKAQWKNRPFWQRAGIRTLGVGQEIQTIKSSFDVSAVLRQGGILVAGNPIAAARAGEALYQAAKWGKIGERHAYETMSEIENRPLNVEDNVDARGKLERTDPFGDPNKLTVTNREEAFRGVLARKIPGVKWSDRTFHIFLNKLRTEVYDGLIHQLERFTGRKATDGELKILAHYVNVASGRGTWPGGVAHGFDALAKIFWSPRLFASRVQYLLGEPLWHVRGGLSPVARALVLSQYARSGAGLASALSLALMAGATIESDPKSKDFGKIRFGNTRIDLMAGLQQSAVLVNQLVSGQQTTQRGTVMPIRGNVPYGRPDARDLMKQFVFGKATPFIQTTINALSGSTSTGQPTTLTNEILNSFAPLFLSDIHDALQAEGVPQRILGLTTAILGAGVGTYQPVTTREKNMYRRTLLERDDALLHGDFPEAYRLTAELGRGPY